jgi:hypothetical protein
MLDVVQCSFVHCYTVFSTPYVLYTRCTVYTVQCTYIYACIYILAKNRTKKVNFGWLHHQKDCDISNKRNSKFKLEYIPLHALQY